MTEQNPWFLSRPPIPFLFSWIGMWKLDVFELRLRIISASSFSQISRISFIAAEHRCIFESLISLGRQKSEINIICFDFA